MSHDGSPDREPKARKKAYHRPEIVGRQNLEVMAIECIGGTAKTVAQPQTCIGPIGS